MHGDIMGVTFTNYKHPVPSLPFPKPTTDALILDIAKAKQESIKANDNKLGW